MDGLNKGEEEDDRIVEVLKKGEDINGRRDNAQKRNSTRMTHVMTTISRTQIFYLEPIPRMMNVQMREKIRGVSVVLSTPPSVTVDRYQL